MHTYEDIIKKQEKNIRSSWKKGGMTYQINNKLGLFGEI